MWIIFGKAITANDSKLQMNNFTSLHFYVLFVAFSSHFPLFNLNKNIETHICFYYFSDKLIKASKKVFELNINVKYSNLVILDVNVEWQMTNENKTQIECRS